jgi:hypothetical protein
MGALGSGSFGTAKELAVVDTTVGLEENLGACVVRVVSGGCSGR